MPTKLLTIRSCFFALLFSFHGIAQVNISVYPDSTGPTINPRIYGAAHEEHMSGWIFSAAGIDTLVQATGVRVLRMGGIGADYYDWEGNDYNGIVYNDFATSITPDSTVGPIDIFLRFCERHAIDPVLTVNFQINDPGKAARLVEYCNGAASSPMGLVRSRKGHAAPYNVTNFCIGNEPDISRNTFGGAPYYRHFGIPFLSWKTTDTNFATPQTYAVLAKTYADSMRARSPIPVRIGAISLASIDGKAWLVETLKHAPTSFDWVDAHYYPNASYTISRPLYKKWLQSPQVAGDYAPSFAEWYATLKDTMTSICGQHKIDLCVFEYSGGLIMSPDPLWWGPYCGLFVADMLGQFTRLGVPGAAVYGITSGFPGRTDFPYWGITRLDTLSHRTASHVLRMFSHELIGTSVKVNSTGTSVGVVGYAAKKANDSLTVVLINKNIDSAFATRINLVKQRATGDVWGLLTDTTILGAPFNGTCGFFHIGDLTVDSSFVLTIPAATVVTIKFHILSGSSVQLQQPRSVRHKITGIFDTHNQHLKISGIMQTSGTMSIDVFDAKGKLVFVQGSITPSPLGYISINFKHTANGTYYVRLRSELSTTLLCMMKTD